MSLGPVGAIMDLSRPKAGVSCTQSRGSNGNHDMFAVASFIGRLPRGRGNSPARLVPRRRAPCRVLHMEASGIATTEFGAALTILKIKQRSAAQWFRTSERNLRR